MAPSDRRSSVSPSTLALAALGSATATFLIGRVGLAGTIIGAAFTPVVIALVTELARKPAERLRTRAVRPGARAREVDRTVYRVEREPRSLLERVSWRRVLVTGLGAFALVVAAVTVTDLARGTSVVGKRGTTFFDRERGGAPTQRDEERAPGTPTDEGETVMPDSPTGEEETETTPTGTEPPATTTAPTGTTATTP